MECGRRLPQERDLCPQAVPLERRAVALLSEEENDDYGHMVYDPYIMRRTQIYLDEAQDRELGRRAAAERTTKSALIRRAIGRELKGSGDEALALVRLRAGLEAAFGAAPHLAEGSTYVDEVRALDADREAALAARRARPG